MMIKKKFFSLVLAASMPFGCTSSTQSKIGGNSSSSGSSSAGTSSSGSTTSGSGSTTTGIKTVGGVQVADLGDLFNKDNPNRLKVKPAADKDKMFLVQRISAYRPVWLNLTKSLDDTFHFWKFLTGVSNVVNQLPGSTFFQESFQRPAEPPTSTLSIHQPLASQAGSDDLATSIERGDSFKTLGHTLSKSLCYPSTPTAVASLYVPTQDQTDAIRPPKSYKLVYAQLGELSEQNYEACKRVQESSTHKPPEQPQPEDLAACTASREGSYAIRNATDAAYGGTGVGNLDLLYSKQSLVIWEPIPETGYHCLGQIITNTTDQPSSTADAGGSYAQGQTVMSTGADGKIQQTSSLDYPVYCVKESYLVEGVLVSIATNGQVDFFNIKGKDANGYSDSNLFWSVPSSMSNADRSKIKVWTLNNKFVRFLPDLKGTPNGQSPGC